MVRTVVFDLDGTLVDTAEDLLAAANACFAGLGLGHPLTLAEDRATALRGGRRMLARGLEKLGRAGDPALIDAEYPKLLSHYSARICVASRPFPGAWEAVRRLRAAGHATAICTNKPEALAERLMTALSAQGLFDSLVGADTLPVRKPDPAPYALAVERAGGIVRRSLIVGDTETDRDTALAAGVPAVLVGFGPEGAGIARLAPEAIISHFDDLPGEVARILG